MPSQSIFAEMDATSNGIGDERALQLALELSMLGFGEPGLHHHGGDGGDSPDLGPFALGALDEVRSKKSQNMTECVPVPSSEHVAEIVGRQGCKIKALRAKTNTYIKTPVRGEEPVFVVTGRKEDVAKAKREILSAAEHFSQIRASRKNNLAGLAPSGAATPPGPPANIPGHVTIQVRVPYRVVGLVVGPKGATIKRIQHLTHTYIVTPSRDKEPVFEVTGLPENVETARCEIEAHIAMRTGACAIAGLDDADLISSLYKSGLNSLLSCLEGGAPLAGSTFSSSCSSSSASSSNGRDLGAIWSSSDRDEGLGDSPSFDSARPLSNIWTYPSAAAASPTDSLLSGAGKCAVCGEGRVTHALVPCGHNLFCAECAARVCGEPEGQCPVCLLPARQTIRIYSANP